MNARANAGELLLTLGKRAGLRALLAAAPEEVRADEAIRELADELVVHHTGRL